MLVISSIQAGSCPAGDDMVTELKNFDAGYSYPCMYSGAIQVDEKTDSNLFYWFFRDEKNDPNAPLVFFTNGGPGSSSMAGLFMEIGPLRLVKDSDGKINVHSIDDQAWTAIANVVFVDIPVGVGYSYGHLKVKSMDQIDEHMITFFEKFYLIHPEMKNRNLFITGQSYGGKYLSSMASKMIDYNQNQTEQNKIPLKGVLIGSGLVEPITQRLSTRQLAITSGLVQFDSIPEVDMIEKRCHDANAIRDPLAGAICSEVETYFSKLSGGMSSFDIRYPNSNYTIPKNMMQEYLNYPEVIENLHISGSTKKTKFVASNSTVSDNLMADQLISYVDKHKKILDNNITLVIYSGGFDGRDGPYGIQKWFETFKWNGMQDFYKSSRNLYYYKSDDDGEIKLGGNYKQHKNFHFLVVYAAGHFAPATQLALTRNMLSDVINYGELICNSNQSCNLDQNACNFMNNCAGQGSCIAGKCY